MKQFIRIAPLTLELVLFVLAGGINAVLTYGIYALGLLALPYSVAYTVSYVSGIFLSYYLNSRFVFKSKMSLGKLVKYPLTYVVQYFSSVGLLYLLVEHFHISTVLAPLVVMAITIPVSFLLSRLIIKGSSNTSEVSV